MRFIRWPLLFCLVYGILWIRARSRSDSRPHTSDSELLAPPVNNDLESSMKRILSEDPQSKDSLSYAFSKLSGRSRLPASASETHGPSAFEKALSELQSLREDPARALEVALREMRELDADHVVERSVLLREAHLVFDRDLSVEMAELLEEEREWLVQNVDEIRDPSSLKGYVFEVMRFSIQNAENSSHRKDILRDMIARLASNRHAIASLRSAVLEYAEWDLPELIESAPPAAQSVLGGTRP